MCVGLTQRAGTVTEDASLLRDLAPSQITWLGHWDVTKGQARKSPLDFYHPFSLCPRLAWSSLQPNVQGHTTPSWPTEDPVSWVRSVSVTLKLMNHKQWLLFNQWVLGRDGWLQRNSSLKRHDAPMTSCSSLMIPGLHCPSSHYKPSLGYPLFVGGTDVTEVAVVWGEDWIRDSEWQVWNKQCNFQEKKGGVDIWTHLGCQSLN